MSSTTEQQVRELKEPTMNDFTTALVSQRQNEIRHIAEQQRIAKIFRRSTRNPR